MNKSAEHIKDLALQLSEPDRADLAAILWSSLSEKMDTNNEAAWIKEVEHRLSEIESEKTKTIPWKTVKETIEKAL